MSNDKPAPTNVQSSDLQDDMAPEPLREKVQIKTSNWKDNKREEERVPT